MPGPPGRLLPEPLSLHPQAGLAQSLRAAMAPFPGSWSHEVLFAPSKRRWWVRGLILNAIAPLLLSCCSFFFALRRRISFLGGIPHSPVDGCSAADCDFGVLAEDEHTSF